MAAVGTLNMMTYASSTNSEGFVLGMKYVDFSTGFEFRFLRNHVTDGALVAGAAVVKTAAVASNNVASWIVTPCKGASQLNFNVPVALAPCAVPLNYYFFGMIDGEFTFALNAANTAFGIGTPITSGNATLGNWISAAGGNAVVAGWSQANAAGGFFPMKVQI